MDQRFKMSIEVINFIIDDLNLENPKQLSDALGFERPERIYKILRGQVSISRNLADIIHAKYPQYDKNWLLTGEGPMKKGATGKDTEVGEVGLEYQTTYSLKTVHQDLKKDIAATNKNLLELSEGMMNNLETLSKAMVSQLMGQRKILDFIEGLDAKKISEATSDLRKLMEQKK